MIRRNHEDYPGYLKELNIDQNDLEWVRLILIEFVEEGVLTQKERNCLDLTLREGGEWAFDTENW